MAGPGRTKNTDSKGGGLAAGGRARARPGWAGRCPHGHAPTPAAGAGGGSASVVWACALPRSLERCRAARGECAGHERGKGGSGR